MAKHTLVCCRDMQNAQEPGTDNEGYGRLVSDYGDRDYHMGTLPSISFCPWCGAPTKEAQP